MELNRGEVRVITHVTEGYDTKPFEEQLETFLNDKRFQVMDVKFSTTFRTGANELIYSALVFYRERES